MSQLCNGDLDRNIHVECFDHNRNGSHSLIGDFFVTLRQLMRGPGDTNVFELINSKKRVSDWYEIRSSTISLFFSTAKEKELSQLWQNLPNQHRSDPGVLLLGLRKGRN